jgi:acyl-CoA reductase-like NAD-dependent aldehyde dehydrogenase
VLNPADESVLGVVPTAIRSDLDAALAAAHDGFKTWSKTEPANRSEIILKAVALMRERIEEMAVTITLEQGKPIAQSRAEILYRLHRSRQAPCRGRWPPHEAGNHGARRSRVCDRLR